MCSRICKHNYRITIIVKIGYRDHSPAGLVVTGVPLARDDMHSPRATGRPLSIHPVYGGGDLFAPVGRDFFSMWGPFSFFSYGGGGFFSMWGALLGAYFGLAHPLRKFLRRPCLRVINKYLYSKLYNLAIGYESADLTVHPPQNYRG